jgi:hypothetical protein
MLLRSGRMLCGTGVPGEGPLVNAWKSILPCWIASLYGLQRSISWRAWRVRWLGGRRIDVQ